MCKITSNYKHGTVIHINNNSLLTKQTLFGVIWDWKNWNLHQIVTKQDYFGVVWMTMREVRQTCEFHESKKSEIGSLHPIFQSCLVDLAAFSAMMNQAAVCYTNNS